MSSWTPTEQRRQEIVEATLRLLARFPLESVTTREVAKVLDLSQPALFRHFRSREQLLLAVVERVREDLEQIVEAIVGRPPDALAQLRALGESLLGEVERKPGLPRLLFAASGPSMGPVPDALRPLVSMQKALVATLVRQGQSEGSLAADVAPAVAATLFVGTLQSLVLDWELAGRPPGLGGTFAPCFGLWVRAAGGPATASLSSSTPAPAPMPAPGATTRGAMRLLDVRPILADGVDPLETILATLDSLPPGGVLSIVAPFRPAPLLALLGRRGHSATVEALDGKAFLLLVVVGGAPPIVDLRDLEPPGPLEHVLEVTTSLGPGGVHLARTPRAPRLLVPRLRERSVRWELLDLPDGSALVRLEAPR
jgi:AcrR family transcriptional regulator